MRWNVSVVLALLLSPASAFAEGSRTDLILERLANANRWRDHVMVVAHRGGWMKGGKAVYAENSLALVDRAVELGAEMVEVDVRKSADGEYVVMHDTHLDRTTTCRGEVATRTASDLARCHLVAEGTGEVSPETVSTLRTFLSAARDRILVNIDNKLDAAELPGIAAVARELGMAEQVILKENLWNAERVAAMKARLAEIGEGPRFMPIVADDAVRDVRFLESVATSFGADAVETINWYRPGVLTQDGGPLFGTRARAAAIRGDWHIWVNTYSIVNKEGGYLAGGRGDKLAVLADLPQEAFGFWVDRGATMIQTDEPEAAIEWLTRNGYRIPYDLTN